VIGKVSFGVGPGVAERDLAVDDGVREVLIVAELVNQHVEREDGIVEGWTVEERNTLEDRAGRWIAPFGPGEPQNA
jgi:hypothetical protein